MKLAVVTETFYPFRGGSAKRYFEVLRRLVRKGYEVDLYTVRLNKGWSLKEDVDGISVYRTELVMEDFITKDGFRSISNVLLFSMFSRRKVKRKMYDVIEVNHCPIFPVLGFGLEARPLSVTFHEVWHSQWYHYVPSKVYAPMGICLEKFYVRIPDVGVAVSNATAERLVSLLGMRRDQVEIIPNGVDHKLFEELNVERDCSRVVYVGRLNPHKKVEWLIDAFLKLKREYGGLRLDIIGDGPLRSHYENYARARGVSSEVKFYGKVDDVTLARMLKRAYIYVLPSIREGQSITTLEAMAAGTPQVVVEYDGNSAVELLMESGSGLIAKPSPENLAGTIRSILADKNLWKRLHSRGLEYVRQYSWDRAAEEYHRVYSSLAGGR